MRQHRRPRRGFTLVELLIIIAVMSLLVSLAIPAIMSSQQTSRKVTCANNLRHFGHAMYSFNSVEGTFPPGISLWMKGPLFKDPEIRAHSYMAYLMPHLEGVSLSGPYHFDETFAATENHSALSTYISAAICPSSPPRESAPSHDFVPSLLLTPSTKKQAIVAKMLDPLDHKYTSKFNGALSDYTVIGLVHADVIRKLGLKEDQSWGLGRIGMFPFPVTNTDDLIHRAANLILHPAEDTFEWRLKNNEVSDGLANTIMMVECSGRPQRWERGKRTERQEPVEGGAWADVRAPLRINGLPEDRLCLLQCDNRDEVYSFHDGGANFLFADGHVDFLSSSTDSIALLSLITPNSVDNSGR